MLRRECPQFVDRLRWVHGHAGGLVHQVDHPCPAPRLGEVDLLGAAVGTVHRHHAAAGGIDGRPGDERLGDVDHLLDVDERLIQLHHRELWVVAGADALVAEDATDLEHPLHAAHDEPLEVQLERDAQVQLHVERVVVGDEGPCVRTAGLDVQDRSLDLDEAAVVQCATERGDHGVADAEVAAGVVVDDEVGVPLTEPGIGVGEAVPLVGHRTHGLRQQLGALDLHAQLALAGGHHGAVHTHPVAEVETLERLEPVVADHGLGDEQLHVVVAVTNGGEHQLAAVAHQHDAAGNGHLHLGLGAGLELAVGAAQFGERVRAIEPIRVRVGAAVAQVGELLQALGLLGGETAARHGVGRLEGVVGKGFVAAHRELTVAAGGCERGIVSLASVVGSSEHTDGGG